MRRWLRESYGVRYMAYQLPSKTCLILRGAYHLELSASSHYIPQQDATAFARLRAAGAILIGKTNMPELAVGFQSDSPVWSGQQSLGSGVHSGGSTGGGAAAAGLSPLEMALTWEDPSASPPTSVACSGSNQQSIECQPLAQA